MRNINKNNCLVVAAIGVVALGGWTNIFAHHFIGEAIAMNFQDFRRSGRTNLQITRLSLIRLRNETYLNKTKCPSDTGECPLTFTLYIITSHFIFV